MTDNDILNQNASARSRFGFPALDELLAEADEASHLQLLAILRMPLRSAPAALARLGAPLRGIRSNKAPHPAQFCRRSRFKTCLGSRVANFVVSLSRWSAPMQFPQLMLEKMKVRAQCFSSQTRDGFD